MAQSTTENNSAASSTKCDSAPLPDPLSILLVGEGNLSFSYALVRRLSRSGAFRRATQSAASGTRGSALAVVTTTFDSEDELALKYPESATYRAYFATKQRVSVRYVGSVNATALCASLTDAGVEVAAQPFDLVIFNNPHIGFEDLYRQRSLLSHFFASAAELHTRGPSTAHPQEVVVALCDDQALRWDLMGCAARSGYLCVAAQPLLPAEYPEYTNRRHQSDAAFPFQRMIQFWFVRPSPQLAESLRELRDEVASWERARQERLAQHKPCCFSCTAWLHAADALLKETPALPEKDAAPLKPTGCSTAAGASSLNFAVSESTSPMPLLSSQVVASVLAPLVIPGSSTAAAAAAASSDHASFTPYVPSVAWAALYRAQRAFEAALSAEAETTCGTSGDSGNVVHGKAVVPPHLDATQLGRPLTTKEAKKLERYLTNYGAAMQAKALQQRQQEQEKRHIWQCADCCPSRVFDTEADLMQHATSKHSGAVQLAPTLYARVHTQIEHPASAVAADPLSAAVEEMTLQDKSDSCYCAVCGLQYKTQEMYDEHLRYLAPLPGEAESSLICYLCDPPKQFTDRRGLEQHRTSKHLSA